MVERKRNLHITFIIIIIGDKHKMGAYYMPFLQDNVVVQPFVVIIKKIKRNFAISPPKK